MKVLHDNIDTFERVINFIGKFIINHNAYDVLKSFSNNKSRYKLRYMGLTLCCEWLKDYLDIVKPDRHVKRLLKYLGLIDGNENDLMIIKKVKNLKTKYTMIDIDTMLWEYCRDEGIFKICGANLECSRCVIINYCNNINKSI